MKRKKDNTENVNVGEFVIMGKNQLDTHRDIKHCFLVLSRDFSQYGSCAGSFYQEQKMANIGEFKIVSSEIP